MTVDPDAPESDFPCAQNLTDDVVHSTVVWVTCDTVLRLNGHSFTALGMIVTAGTTLRIVDPVGGGQLISDGTSTVEAGINVQGSLQIQSGFVQATGGDGMAGIQVKDFNSPAAGIVDIDGGVVEATGGHGGAGIGSETSAVGGQIWIRGGTVNATGGSSGAGIGGGNDADNNHVWIGGGAVTATGGSFAAGIGGGHGGDGGPIRIEGGVVTAQGGSWAAGIGGGYLGDGESIYAGGDVVNALAGQGAAAIGGGELGRSGWIRIGGPTNAHGADGFPAVGQGMSGTHWAPDPDDELWITGDLHLVDSALPTDHFNLVRVYESGRILGPEGDETTGTVTGTNHVENGGVIAIAANSVSAPVIGNHTAVSFDVDGIAPVTVFAPTFMTGFRTLPTAYQGIDAFAGWQHTGSPFTATSPLPGGSTIGSVASLELTAAWDSASVSFDQPEPVTVAAGDVAGLFPALADGAGAPVALDDEGWDWTVPSELSVTLGDDGWELTGTTIGTYVVTAAATIQGRTYSGDLDVTVTPGAADSIDVDFAGSTTAGGSITLSATGEDEFGNDLGDVTAGVTFTSSVASDVVSGAEVSFTEAGTRTITATHADGATDTVTVTVSAGPVASMDVSYTGSTTAGGSITLSATGEDAYGNDLGDVTGAVMISSSEASDVIDGDEVSFTEAGARTITVAHLNGTTATLNVTVAAGPVDSLDISYTGSTTAGGTITLTAMGGDEFGNDLGDVTTGVTFTSSVASDVVDGDEVMFTEAGLRTITVTHTNGTTATVSVTVVAGSVDSLDVSYTGSTTAGGSITLSATGEDVYGNDLGDVTGDVTFTTSVASDVVDGDEVTFTESGGRTITATHTNGTTTTLNVTVAAGPVDSLDASYTGDTTAGGTITLTTMGEDEFGNDLGDVTGAVTFTSSVASDVVDGDEVSFTEAGSRAITATHVDGATATLSVTVSAGPVALVDVSYTGSTTAGGTVTLSATGEDTYGNSLGDVTGDVTFTSSVASDVVDGDEVTFTESGARTITATHTDGATATLEVLIAAGAVEALSMSFTGEAKAGGTITFRVTGTDEFGNVIGDVTGDVVLTSSVATDVIVGNTVTFPTASPHTITATHVSGATASITVEVSAAVSDNVGASGPGGSAGTNAGSAAALPATGATSSQSVVWLVIALGLALVAAGAAVLRVRPRHH